MSNLFDENGQLNSQFAQQVYDQASGQVTGQYAAGVPILGAGVKFDEVQEATPEMVGELKAQIVPALEQGIDPNTPVMLGLYQCAQFVRMFEAMAPSEQEHAPEPSEPTSLQTIFTALHEAIHHVKRQQIHGKHEQDRADAAEWLEKYAPHIEWLTSRPSDELVMKMAPTDAEK